MVVSTLQQEQLNRILNDWRLTPATLAHKISRGQWISKHFLLHISAMIATELAKGNARIIISAPPRHGKSELASIYVPTWTLERFPNRYVILSSYGSDLSVAFGRRVRDFFIDPANEHLLRTRIRRDTSKAAAWLTQAGGGMYSVGVGGPITGRGAHVLLIDDYIKEIKEALSQAYRDYIWNWFVTTAFTRLEPGGSVIIIATRWHTDDLIGRILKNLRHENWKYIEIPAIAEGPNIDMFGRQPGEALFPERYPIEALQERKGTLGTIFFDALFQQKPVDESKALADGSWLRGNQIVKSLPTNVFFKVGRCWDLAATQGGGDFTASTKQHYSPVQDISYISDSKRAQLSPAKVEELVRKTALADGTDVDIYIEQEPGSAGLALVDHYIRNVLPEFTVKGVPVAGKKKVIRAQPFLAAAEGKKIFLIEGPWNEDFITEFDEFPGLFDDQVDTAAAGYVELSGKKVFSATWGRKKPSNPGRGRRKINAAAMASVRVRGATFGRNHEGTRS